MPAKRLNTEQLKSVDDVHEARRNFMVKKLSLKRDLEDELKLRLLSIELEVSKAMQRAEKAGVPGSVIRSAVGIANWDSYKALRDLAPRDVVDREVSTGERHVLTAESLEVWNWDIDGEVWPHVVIPIRANGVRMVLMHYEAAEFWAWVLDLQKKGKDISAVYKFNQKVEDGNI